MHNEVLEKYLNNDKILYIYEIGLQIHGLFTDVEDRDFLIICMDNYTPEGFIGVDDVFTFSESNKFGTYNYVLYHMADWFNHVLNNDILAWMCACLNKKFVHKEYVKLMLKTDPLGLRKTYEVKAQVAIKSANEQLIANNTLTGQKLLWSLVEYVMFANQIIENHKIVNFKEPAEAYKKIVNGQIADTQEIIKTFESEMYPHLERFKKYTDEMLAKSKLKYINQDVHI